MAHAVVMLVVAVWVACLLASCHAFVRRPQVSQSRRILIGAGAVAPKALIEEVCTNAARRAGVVLLEGTKVFSSASIGSVSSEAVIHSKQGSRDILTDFDTKAQNVIKETILATQEFREHKFLGEEDVAPGRDAAAAAIAAVSSEENLWIVDPIDGTTNFAHGMPGMSGVIIAYCSLGVTQFSCIYDPYRDEMFTAWREQGAYLNGVRIRCCTTPTLADSVVSTGSPPNVSSLNACLRAMNLISSEVRTVRLIGSAAIMLAWVACGRLTAYFEADLHCWDSAAGALLIKEAGGQVTDVWGDEFNLETRNLVASNGVIHAALLSRLVAAEMFLKEN